jgi:hypothetical protein
LSQLLIQHYLNDLSDLRRASGSARESVVREAFKTLLKNWGKAQDLIFIPEYEYQTPQKTRVYPDGALLHALRVPLGYWEAKDEEDNLDDEIEKKFRKGYPQDNIIFDDSHEAVLIQNKQVVMRCGVGDPDQLQKLLQLFFGYEREEIADFRKAVTQFRARGAPPGTRAECIVHGCAPARGSAGHDPVERAEIPRGNSNAQLRFLLGNVEDTFDETLQRNEYAVDSKPGDEGQGRGRQGSGAGERCHALRRARGGNEQPYTRADNGPLRHLPEG